MIPQKRMVSQTTSLPAPTGGLNAIDAISNMPPTDAVILDNMFPTPTSVNLRNGYVEHVPEVGGPVETLMNYAGLTANQLFAIGNGSLYDVTSAGSLPSADVSGLSNSRWQYTNFGTAGGQYLYAVNGQDDALLYDGSMWTSIDNMSSPAITGVATSSLIHVHAFKNRLWFIEEDSMSVWYLPIASIGGAATELDLAPQFKLGGYLMVMTSWTVDNAAGVNDYAVFISSEGEVLVYQGTDPSTAGTWALVGTFRIGRPIGRRCVMKTGSDVGVLCADGFIALSASLLTDRAQPQKAITGKITNLINADVQSYGNNFGWQPILYPIGQKILINVPEVEQSMSYQYVMNTVNGSWCRFTGWNASCFEFFEDSLFFGGSDGTVYQCDTGNSDNGENIESDVLQAYNYFNIPGRQKHFKLTRPVFLTPGQIGPAISINVDFRNRQPTSNPTFSGAGGAIWDVALWDVSFWSAGDNIVRNWQSTPAIGFAGGLRMQLSQRNLPVQWQATDFVYEAGGVL